MRQNEAKLRKIAGKNAQNVRENCAYVVTIYKKNVFKNFCVGNTVRYKEVIGIAMFRHEA